MWLPRFTTDYRKGVGVFLRIFMDYVVKNLTFQIGGKNIHKYYLLNE